MFIFLRDLIRYPFSDDPNNRFWQLLTFCFKDYPVYFRVKPSLKKVALFFVLAVRIILYGYNKKPQ